MKKIIYFLPIFFLAFTSCEQDANVDVPEVDPKLVINCFITPQDSILRANISMSMPVFGSTTNNGPITDATVTLYGNSSSVVLSYNANTYSYEASSAAFSILAGNEYHIVASVPSGLNADAYTTVPSAPVNFTSSMSDTITNQDQSGYEGQARITYSFSDPGGQQDFYRLVPYHIIYSQWSIDTNFQRAGWELFTDENADGTTISRNFTSYYYAYNGDSIVAIDLYFMHGNYDYYSFHKSIENYSGDNPFAEPTLIYSNVNNGLGIFAAANGVYRRHWR